MGVTEDFIQAVRDGENILLTGAGGTGKTWTLNRMREKFKDKVIQLTATTGLAGLHLKAPTIHSFLGFGIKSHVNQLQLITKKRKSWSETCERIEKVDIIIIDECSMLRADVIDLIDALLRLATLIDEPFGGKQIIFVGDFLQIPPVIKREESIIHLWAFQSAAWKNGDIKNFLLTEVKRQTDVQIINALNQVRVGKVGMLVNALFSQRENAIIESGLAPIKLRAKNKLVDKINAEELELLEGDLLELKGSYTYHAAIVSEEEQRQLWFKMSSATTMPDTLELKVGARIICTQNDRNGKYANGSMGVFRRKLWVVDTSTSTKYMDLVEELKNHDLRFSLHGKAKHLIIVEHGSDTYTYLKGYRKAYEYDGADKSILNYSEELDGPVWTESGTDRSYYSVKEVLEVLIDHRGNVDFIERSKDGVVSTRYVNTEGNPDNDVEFHQFPIRLAWAITIHKSQGMTLDAAEIDCAGVFGNAMMYVALSRVKTLGGLRLLNWNPDLIKADYEAVEFYKYLENPDLIPTEEIIN